MTLTQEDFTADWKPLPTSPGLRAGRINPLPMDDIKLRQCNLGELCWVAIVSRPDICVRVARISPRTNNSVGVMCIASASWFEWRRHRSRRRCRNMHRPLVRGRHLDGAVRLERASGIEGGRSIVARRLRRDGRMLPFGANRRKGHTVWDMRLA